MFEGWTEASHVNIEKTLTDWAAVQSSGLYNIRKFQIILGLIASLMAINLRK